MEYGFCDLCVNVPEEISKLKEILDKICTVGYRTVAINQTVDEKIFDNDKKKKGENSVALIAMPDKVQEICKEFEGKLKILKRLTFAFSDGSKTYSLTQQSLLKRYDLFAVTPKNHNAFQFACANLNADIISLDIAYSGIRMTRKLYLQAVDRGIHFEILSANVINKATYKLTVHYAHLFYTYGKSKNVIISSGASDSSFIRDPYSIISMGRYLGLNEANSKSAIYNQCHYLILKGISRICGKVVFKVSFDAEDASC